MTEADLPLAVYVVDDDPSVRRSLARLLTLSGYRTETFESAQEFLGRGSARETGCLVLDLQLPGLSGLDLQDLLAASDRCLQIVFITGHGDIPASVKAMKGGAVDFIQKPFESDVLLEAVRQAQAKVREDERELEESRELGGRVARLTPRERQVWVLVAAGWLNKQVAAELGIAEKTVKVHRGNVMRKLAADSLADLVRMADRAGMKAPGADR